MNVVEVWMVAPIDHRPDFTYEGVVAHQVGNGAVQVVLEDGVQYVHFDPAHMKITPDEETQAKYKAQVAVAYASQPEESEDSPSES